MFRLAAPFVGLAALLASPAFAQSAPTQQQTPSDPNRVAKDIQAGATWLGWGNANVGVNTECGKLLTTLKGLDADAAALERLNKGFEKFGYALSSVAAASQVAQGQYGDATQTVAEVGLDKAVCVIWPGPVCASWSAGRLVGTTIKMMPWWNDPQHRTIEDVVTDAEVRGAQWLMPSLDQPMNVENMRAAFDAFQAQRRALLNARDRVRDHAGQCNVNDNRAGADEGYGAARQSTSADRATSRFNDLAPAYIPSGSNDSGASGGASAPAYSAPAVQQSQRSSDSGAIIGQALGAVLQGYVAGKAANQSSTTSRPSAAPASSGQGCTYAGTDTAMSAGTCQ